MNPLLRLASLAPFILALLLPARRRRRTILPAPSR